MIFDINSILNQLKTQAIQAVASLALEYAQVAINDIILFIDGAAVDLETYVNQRLTGAINQQEFEDLLRQMVDDARMDGLLAVGRVEEEIDRVKNTLFAVLKLVIGGAIQTSLNKLL